MPSRLIICLLFALCALCAPAALAAERVAVVIGNAQYKNGIPAVNYAVRDALAIKAYLTGVLGFKADDVIFLENAGKAEMEATFGNERSPRGRLWRYANPEKGAEVFVFYSGHGVPGLNDRRRYLLPVDADPDFADLSGYPLSLLFNNLKAYSKATVVLDACFSGDSAGGTLFPSSSGINITAQGDDHGANLTVLTAAGAGQLASWDHRSRHGLFTEYFLRAVYGEGDLDLDGQIRADEIKSFLDDQMTRIARRTYGREQTVSLSSSGNPAFAVFTPWAKPRRPQISARPRRTVPTVSNPPVRQQPAEEEVPDWKPVAKPAPASRPQPQAEPPGDSTTDLVLKTIIKGLEVYLNIEQMKRATVTRRKISVRNHPRHNADKIGWLRPDQFVQVTGRVTGTNWLRVNFGGEIGYIKAANLSALRPGEYRAWQQAVRRGTPKAYREYLGRYPRGIFSQRAKAFLHDAAGRGIK